MKNKIKFLIFPILAVLCLGGLIASFVAGNQKAKEAEGENGVIYTEYFTGDTVSKDWITGFSRSVLSPETKRESLHFSGSGVKPSAAMLGVELPKNFDLYFTADIAERGGDSRDAGIFFCVGGDYEQRYQLFLSEGTVKVKYNGTTDVAVKKLEGLKAGSAYGFHIKVTGAKMQVFFEGAEEPCLKFVASGQFESFEQARTFGVFSYAKDFYFDNLVVTNGEDFIPITKINIAGKDGKNQIEGRGNSLQMEMFVNPSNATDLSLVWSIDNEEIAEITQDGLLTSKGYGEVIVSARTRDGSNLQVSKKIELVMGEDAYSTSKLYTNRKNLLTDGYTIVNSATSEKNDQTSTLVLGSGRIAVVAAGNVSLSDDGGKTWSVGMQGNFVSGSLFEMSGKLHLITADKNSRNLVVYVSEDEGETWSNASVIDKRKWSEAPSEVLVQNGSIYLTMDVESASAVSKGYKGNAALSPILMRATIGDDLTKPESWVFSSEIAYVDILPEGTVNAVDYVDVPNNYGDAKSTGWAASNLFQIYDKEQMWYDEDMASFFIYMHGSKGEQGYATLLKIVESENGAMSPVLIETVAAKKILFFVPMPGGNQPFHIIYDEKSGLYWQTSNYLNEDNRVALYFSKNAYDWSFAGIVAKSDNGMSCPTIAVDGNDLVMVTNQSDGTACYRIADFRKLVY